MILVGIEVAGQGQSWRERWVGVGQVEIATAPTTCNRNIVGVSLHQAQIRVLWAAMIYPRILLVSSPRDESTMAPLVWYSDMDRPFHLSLLQLPFILHCLLYSPLLSLQPEKQP